MTESQNHRIMHMLETVYSPNTLNFILRLGSGGGGDGGVGERGDI